MYVDEDGGEGGSMKVDVISDDGDEDGGMRVYI
jgi:hypothetical protein